ncbi:hypothetical protein ACFQV2_18325 [Actinokineospora soli]|uniref:Secreted protein n=1 Tax=Actinokineospora soli TaxID=1048753 RepID=A0ABW2TQ95_9PSEU
MGTMVFSAAPAQAYYPGCDQGFLTAEGALRGGWARCGTSAGVQYQAMIRCEHFPYRITYHYGPWKYPGTGNSEVWCPSGAGATNVWVNVPD